MFLRTAPTFLLWSAAALFLARFELHTDDTGVEVALLLLFTFSLAFWRPRHPAWIASLALAIPAAELLAGLSRPHAPKLPTLAGVAALTAALGLAGAFSGSLLRKSLFPSLTNSRPSP